ncbi:DUF3572 domain-containing protein [Mangrovicoccus algicola]|uniref:DUF3572 domain-containing protein n=1 Tax=Mangrovicoccus algicola TaxID=2771008 RepID=A0A8J7CUT8_9RHOB|nr:DUF3572 domain-containing protein [Mangrovicoccus algicola]MBE3637934.1 DUF3572 domain-containing protein [Mangrovicoccus algicola]
MTPETASALALDAITWMAAEADLLEVFLNASGISAEALKAGIAEPEIHAAVLDFVLMDDAWVLAAAAHAGCDPHDLNRARQCLPGGALPHWT